MKKFEGVTFRVLLAFLLTTLAAFLPGIRPGGLAWIPWNLLGVVADNYVTDNSSRMSNMCTYGGMSLCFAGGPRFYCSTGSAGILVSTQWLLASNEWNEANGCPILAPINSSVNTAVISQAVLTVPIHNVTLNNCNIDRGLITATGTITGGTMLTVSGVSGTIAANMLVSDTNNPRNVLRNTTIVSGTGPTYTITNSPLTTQPDVGPEPMQFYAPNRLDYTWIDTRRESGCQFKNYAQIGIQRGADVWIKGETGTNCYQYTGHPGRRWDSNGVGSTVPAVPASADLVAFGTVDGVAPNVLLQGNNYCGGDGVIQLCSPGLTTDSTWGGEQDCKYLVSYNDTVSTISGVAALVGTGAAAGPFQSTISQIVYKNLNGTCGTSCLSAISSSNVAINTVIFDGGTLDATSDTTGSPSIIVEATSGCSGCSTQYVTAENGTILNPLTIDARVDTGAQYTTIQNETFGAPRTSTGTNLITRGDSNTTIASNNMTAPSNGNCATFGSNGYLTSSITVTSNDCAGVTNGNVGFSFNNVAAGLAQSNVASPAAGQTSAKGFSTASAGSGPGTTSLQVKSNNMSAFTAPNVAYACNPSSNDSNTTDGMNVGGTGGTACNNSPF